MKSLLGVGLVLLAAAAWAEPDWLAERPLTLPAGTVRPVVELSLTNGTFDVGTPDGFATATGSGFTASAGLDVGWTHRFQAGIWTTFPLAPDAAFGAVTANAQYAVVQDKDPEQPPELGHPVRRGAMNLRFDLGIQQESINAVVQGFQSSSQFFGFVIGAGVPLRYRFSRKLSLVSGNTSARGFSSQPFLAASGTSLYGNTLFTDDVVTVGVWSSQGASLTGWVLHLPVGLQYQPVPMFAVTVRSGYRLAYSSASDSLGNASTSTVHFVPVAVDLEALLGSFEVGLTSSLTGTVGGDTSQGYGDIRKIDLWAMMRF